MPARNRNVLYIVRAAPERGVEGGGYSGNYRGHYLHCVRESESDYCSDHSGSVVGMDGSDRPSAIDFGSGSEALLKQPLWPQFPDGAYLNSKQAAHIYRAAHGISGLVTLLNRTAHARGLARDYRNDIDRPLGELQESRLWSALIALSADLVNLTDELHSAAMDVSVS